MASNGCFMQRWYSSYFGVVRGVPIPQTFRFYCGPTRIRLASLNIGYVSMLEAGETYVENALVILRYPIHDDRGLIA
jgi:hypothetical protein